MRSPVPKARVEAAFAALGIHLPTEMAGTSDFESAVQRYEQVRGKARAAFRQLAKQAHPDHGGDEDTMRRLVAAWETVKGTNLRRRPRRPRPARTPAVNIDPSGAHLEDIIRMMQTATTSHSVDMTAVANDDGGVSFWWRAAPHPGSGGTR